MPVLLTDQSIKKLPTPAKGLVIVRDAKERGLGVRVMPTGSRSFVLIYSYAHKKHVITIGQCSSWQVTAAREKAAELKSRIKLHGFDPAKDRQAQREADAQERNAPTVNMLCDEFEKRHLPKLRPATQSDYKRIIRDDIRPPLGKLKVLAVTKEHIEDQLDKIQKRAPKSGTLFLALVSRLFTFAMGFRKDGKGDYWAATNPVKGIARPKIEIRQRDLSPAEMAALNAALDAYSDQDMADVIRLLAATGARSGETKSSQWPQFNEKLTVWTKPSSHTKQKRKHVVPLNSPARELLLKRRKARDAELKRLEKEIAEVNDPDRKAELQVRAQEVRTFVFLPRRSHSKSDHIVSLKKAWHSICLTAGLVTRTKVTDKRTGKVREILRHNARIHDLRHHAASTLVSKGVSLYIVGTLLGHSSLSTTQRYSRVDDDAQRAAVELLGETLTAKPKKAAKR